MYYSLLIYFSDRTGNVVLFRIRQAVKEGVGLSVRRMGEVVLLTGIPHIAVLTGVLVSPTLPLS